MIREKLSTIPSEPGVYVMKDCKGNILYIGKAKSLKTRVKQYFTPGRDGREMVPYLTQKVYDIETILVPNEKEALLLENTLIKKHKPPYNVLLKDDKTFISIAVTNRKKWPMITVVRIKGKPNPEELHFGPFTSAYAARQTLKTMQKIFPLRQCSDSELRSRKRPCILYGIKRCIAPCVGKCTEQEYTAHVQKAIAFLKGENTELLKDLYEEMSQASNELEFERAAAIHETIRQIEATVSSQTALVHSAKKDCDVFGIYRSGNAFSLMKLIFREGRMTGAEPYYFRNIASDEDSMWETFLLQHYQNEKTIPKEILLPRTVKQKIILEELIGAKIQIPEKGVKKKLIEMAQKNAATSFQEESQEKVLLTLQEVLHLKTPPVHIECFDTSNISGTDQVASCITYIDGAYESSKTRLYTIKEISKGDDYGAMREALTRHYKKAKSYPDLLVLDGGKGQRNIAIDVLKELEIASIEVISLAKEESLHTKGITQEKVYVSHMNDPVLLPLYSAELQLLQRIRDEAHRVAIAFHKKKRSKRVIKSTLEELPGIGPKKRKALLTHFGSLKRIKEASEEELKQVHELTEKDRKTLADLL